MIDQNQQVLLCNELNDKTRFYKFFNAEALMRDIASKCENTWIMVLFACCRQKYIANMSDKCISFGPEEAVEVRKQLIQLEEAKIAV